MAKATSLQLRFLGELELSRGRDMLKLPQSKKTRALLAYLAVTGRPHRRERLCSLLWDVADDPRAALRWSLSKLRALVDEPRHLRLLTEGDTVGFDTSEVSVDVHRLRAALESGTDVLSTEKLEALAREFRGDFLEDLELPDFLQFQSWRIAEREEARRRHAKIRRALRDRLAGEPERALEHALVLAELEPYDESAHAGVVRLLLALGRTREAEQSHAAAKRQLEDLTVPLSGELGQAWPPQAEGPASKRPFSAVHALANAPQPTPEQRTRYARNGDVHIAYQVVGEGPLTIIYLPGWVSHVEYGWEEPAFAHVLQRLSSFARLIILDRRGTGLSDRVAQLPTLEEQMEDTRAVMDAVGCESAAFIGISEGGPISMMFACTYPRRTAALVLCNTTARIRQAPDYPKGWGEPEGREFLDYLSVWGTGRSVDLLAPSRSHDADFRRSWARFERFAVSPAGFQTMMEIAGQLDARHLLEAINVPTLVIHRTGDRVLPVEGARYMAERIRGARYVELPGDDHFIWTGDVEAILDEVQEFLTGVRGGGEIDRQLLTLLFTDISNSTSRAALLGDRYWAELLARHDALVRRELAKHRGNEVDHLGDGFLASFDGPARAIRCAASIIAAAREIGIDLKAGLHTGECELRDGRVQGLAVHIGARVVAEAKPGEVLVSQTVRDLVAGSGIKLENRGTRELKGVPGKWGLFGLV